MSQPFHKMHGAGNDFVLLDLRDREFEITPSIAASLANRRTGIGFDQLLLLRAPSEPGCLADFEVFNADGSQAEQCGNGVRCIGLYLRNSGEAQGAFRIKGPVSIIGIEETKKGWFRVDMGPPRFEPADIPILLEPVNGHYSLEIDNETINMLAVSMGNPHAVIEVPDIKAAKVDQLGPIISQHPAFPEGCNAGFIQVRDRKNVELRVFERGAGETQACGSGACAAVSSLVTSGKLDNEVLVNQVGGTLIIGWNGQNEPVMMTGQAVHVFTGMLT